MPSENASNAVLLVNTSDGRYSRYFAELNGAVNMISSWTGTSPKGALDVSKHTNYLRGLAACFSILESRFTFEIDDSLMVDLTDSGYPHSFMLAKIAVDRAESLSAHLKGSALGSANLKQIFLDDLFQNGTVNRALLNRIASARYAEVVADMEGIFDPRFTCGDPQNVDTSKTYAVQWSVFDPVINIPLLCGMTFEYTGKDLPRSLESLKLVLKYETKAGISIAALAHAIDNGVADINPIAMSRATLGPLHLPGFTEANSSLCALKSVPVDQGIVVEITIDHTSSVRSTKPSPLGILFGVSPQPSQVFAVRTQDPLCYERGADAVERIVILPHRLLQGIPTNDRHDDRGEFTLIPYIKEGELQ